MGTEADKWNTAYSTGAEELTGLYAEDACAFPPDRELVRGNRSIERMWKDVQRDWTDSKLTQLEKFQAGEFLYESGSWTANFRGRPVHGKYMTLWRKEGGAYKIFRDMWNRDHEL